VPWAIITPRWKIVSHDAAVNSAIIIGSAKGELRSLFFMSYDMMNHAAARKGAPRCFDDAKALECGFQSAAERVE